MKTVYKKTAILLFIMVLFHICGTDVFSKPPDNFVGMDLEKAEKAYSKAVNAGKTAYTIHLAEVLFYAGKFDEAVDAYVQADELGLIITDPHKRNYVTAAIHAGKESPYSQETGYFSRDWKPVVKVTPFCGNSPNEDFAPFYWNEILFITSSRQKQGGRYDFTQMPFLNIHAFSSDCLPVDIPDYFPDDLQTGKHDGPIAVSADGNLLIITRNYEKPNRDGFYNMYLDQYLKVNNRWQQEKMFTFIEQEYSSQHPYFNNSDSVLYFSSNMPGGHGGFDLYTSKWDGKSWGKPVNMGPEINSVYDEVFPSVSPQGDLMYATNHIETGGGLDLVLYRDETRFLFPEPFNTIYEDFAVTFKTPTSGYFSSNRERSNFDDDIFVFELEEEMVPAFDFYVEVLDEQSMEPVPDVQVRFFSVQAQAQGLLLTNEKGMGFLTRGPAVMHEFSFELYKQGYKSMNAVSSEFVERDGMYVLTLLMSPDLDVVEEPTGYFVVYFDNDHPDPRTYTSLTRLSYEETYNNYMLRKDEFYQNSSSSTDELDSFFMSVTQGMERLRWFTGYLTDELREGRHYTINFTSHASPLASNAYNLLVSQRRFSSVENFFKAWSDGSLIEFITRGELNYANNPYGSSQAQPGVSDDRSDPAKSIYSVEASRERRVTITWKRSNE